ncbi:helix-turn-helix domain-containing protein [Streptomyces sp. NBC_01546]|uniref:helix-turn-helix domain-containing protein n=1 Tax=Streptomyces sp. NBC_01546 TaxID=2975872 RepID=UPI003866CC91
MSGAEGGSALGESDRRRFADLLTELKDRRGLSFEALARKAHMSRSSVHRYCRGIIVPVEFGTAERLARICGASSRELSDLYRYWAAASLSAPSLSATETPPPPPQPQPLAPLPVPAQAEAPEQESSARSRHPGLRPAVISLALLVLCVVALGGSGRVPRPVPATGSSGRGLAVDAWSQAPTAVPDRMFGMTLNSSTGAMPTFQVDTVRLWDSRTRWSNIQSKRGEFDWSILDRLVDGANRAGLPVLFTMGGTPAWASPNGPRTAYDDGSRTSPPDDLADWKAFVAAVSGRYRGRIAAYELWVMGNDARYFSGSPETLVEMTRTAKAVLDAADPDATVVCPSMGRLWEDEGRQLLERFARLRGYDHCDVAGVKLYQRSAEDPPEQMLGLAAEIDRAFHRGGAHPPVWSTGTTYEIPLQKPLDEPTASAYAVRFFLVGLYARYQRMYFYNWGGTKIPIVMQPEGQPPTAAALHVEEARRWVHGARIRSCGSGLAAGLPEGVWQCRLDRDGSDAAILWNPTGTARVPVPRQVSQVHHLDGSTSAVRADRTAEVGPLPVLLGDVP